MLGCLSCLEDEVLTLFHDFGVEVFNRHDNCAMLPSLAEHLLLALLLALDEIEFLLFLALELVLLVIVFVCLAQFLRDLPFLLFFDLVGYLTQLFVFISFLLV